MASQGKDSPAVPHVSPGSDGPRDASSTVCDSEGGGAWRGAPSARPTRPSSHHQEATDHLAADDDFNIRVWPVTEASWPTAPSQGGCVCPPGNNARRREAQGCEGVTHTDPRGSDLLVKLSWN